MTDADADPVPGEQALTFGKYPLIFGKYHGAGNDFLVHRSSAEDPWPGGAELARRLCDRHRGLGADGLIVVTPAPPASTALLDFALWNADGSVAEMSGNGMRCVAHAALDAGMVAEGVAFGVRTPAGPKEVVVERRGPGLTWSRVAMGRPVFEGDPGGGSVERCNVGHGQMAVDMGNPHLVILGPDPATVDVAGIGAALDAGVVGGRNVEFVTLGPGADELTMRVWERGVGETLACGTGSCAAAVALQRWGRVGSTVTVHQPGGAVAVDIGADGEVTLAGPSRHVARCHVEASWLRERVAVP